MGLSAGAAHAQAIERNLPPPSLRPSQEILAPNALPHEQDDRPIGPRLIGLLLLGPTDVVRTLPVNGVVPGLVPRINTRRGLEILRPFVGRPMSRKLIAEIEAAIARYYRKVGYPFVSVSTPPQIIGTGILQVRVVEFHAGTVATPGLSGTAQQVRNAIRLRPGEPVDALKLSADLDWLNRDPFHHVEAIFSPGDAFGQTDLNLQVTSTKPWQIYAGYANSGSAATGFDRYLLGGQIGGLLGPGSLASYQFTAAPDFFDSGGKVFGDADHPEYLSHGLRLAAPVAGRQELEVSFDHVETNTVSRPFAARQITDELSLGYRASLSNFSRLPGDITLGVEAKQESRNVFFTGLDVLDNRIQVYQAYLGWSVQWSNALGGESFAITIHDSPGGLNDLNSGAAFSSLTSGRVTRSSYQYVNLQFYQTTHLPAGYEISNALIAQYATDALPDTEQLGVGGEDLVRGYTLDDGAYDTAIVSRNEIHLPTLPLPLPSAHLYSLNSTDAFTPFAFLDAGFGANRETHKEAHPVSTGVGARFQVGPHLAVNLIGAYALTNTMVTRSGDAMLTTKATLTF